MATIDEAKKQIAQQRQQVEQQRQQQQRQQEQLRQQRLKITQQELRQQGLKQRQQRALEFKRRKEKALSEVRAGRKEFEKKVGIFETEAQKVEKQIADYEVEQKRKQQEVDNYNRAMGLVQRKAAGKKIVLFYEPSEVQRIYKELINRPDIRDKLDTAQAIQTGQLAALPFYSKAMKKLEAGTATEVDIKNLLGVGYSSSFLQEKLPVVEQGTSIVSESSLKDIQNLAKTDKEWGKVLTGIGGYVPQEEMDKAAAQINKMQQIQSGTYPFSQRASEVGVFTASMEKIKTSPRRFELWRQEKLDEQIEKWLEATGGEMTPELEKLIAEKKSYSLKMSNVLGVGAQLGTYAVPFLGESFLIGGGIEQYSYEEGRQNIQNTINWLGEKGVREETANVIGWGLPAAQIGIGLWSMSSRLGILKSPTKSALDQPKRLTGESRTIYQTKITSKNIGRLRKVYDNGQLKFLSKGRGGKVTQVSNFQPSTYTKIKGRGWNELQITGKGGRTYGQIIKSRGFGRSPYNIRYSISNGKITYDIFIGNKFVRTYTTSISPSFGYTEPSLFSKSSSTRTKMFPTKDRLDLILKDRVWKSNLIKLDSGKYNAQGQYISYNKQGDLILTSSAKKDLFWRWKKGGDTYALRLRDTSKVAKFSKTQPSDVEYITGKFVSQKGYGATSTLYKTPRFKQFSISESGGIGRFSIFKETNWDRFLSSQSQMLSSKRATSLGQVGIQTGVTPSTSVLTTPRVDIPLFLTGQTITPTGASSIIGGGTSVLLGLGQQSKSEMNLVQRDIQKPKIDVKAQTIPKETPKIIDVTKATITPKEKQLVTPKVEPIQEQVRQQRPTQRTQQQLRQRQQEQILHVPRKPILPPPPIPTTKGILKKVKEKRKGGLLDLQLRRFGRWFTLKRGLTKEQALKLGKRRTLSSLAASFRLTKEGKPLDIDEGLGRMFRPSKRGEKGVFIEKRKFRLDVPSEVKEILSYKRRKKKKSKKVNWFK